jgi:hypothetical protein
MTQKLFQNPQEKGVIGSWWSGLVNKNKFLLSVPFFFFLLLLLFLPTQLGLHFWPAFAYVNGVRVDYLSPTFYVTDLLLILVLVTSLLKRRDSAFWFKQAEKHFSFFFLILLGAFSLSVITSLNSGVGLYGALRLIEMYLMVLMTKYFWMNKQNRTAMLLVFFLSLCFSEILAIGQILHQQYFGGLLYLLGERAITPLTPGAATVEVLGSLILRPYATFSHPNVLAGYLLLSSLLIIENKKYFRRVFHAWHVLAVLALTTVALLSTLSRIALILWFLYVCYLIFIHLENKQKLIRGMIVAGCASILIIIFASLFPVVASRFTVRNILGEALHERTVLLYSSWKMIEDYIFFGVGPLNFIPALPGYLKEMKQVYLLQPVHNVFILFLVENGIIVFFGVVLVITKKLRNLRLRGKIEDRYILHLFLFIVILGLFDHYFLTSQQGRLLLGFCIGLLFTTDKNRLKRKEI